MSWDEESAWAQDDDAFAAAQEIQARRELADPDAGCAACGECGGTGIDLGSLHEPEECRACLGRGFELDQTGEPVRYPIFRRDRAGRLVVRRRVA